MVEGAINVVSNSSRDREASDGSEVEHCINRAPSTAVEAEVVALDRIGKQFGSVVKRNILRQTLTTPQGQLPALNSVSIRKYLRSVTIKDKQVGVPPKCQSYLRLLTELLLQAREPNTRPFPRIEVAVETVSAERPIRVSEDCASIS